MKIIRIKLICEDVNNLSDGDAIQTAIDMVCEVFGKEEQKDHPRLKLLLIEAKHG